MAVYTETTLHDLLTQLAAALGDPDNIFFPSNELRRYIWEGMTVFQAFSNYWREEAFWSPAEETRWEVLSESTLANLSGVNLLACPLTDRQLLELTLDSLLESIPTTWANWGISELPTEQFTADEIIAALNRVYHRFIWETGLRVRRIEIALSPGQEWFQLPERVVDVMVVAMLNKSATPYYRYPLYKTGRADFDMMQGWGGLEPGIPNGWSLDSDTLRLRIYPPAIDIGWLEVLVQQLPDQQLSPQSVATRLEVPPNLWWVLKYGILADLLRHDGQAPDWPRAEYCEKRFQDGIKLAQMMNPTIINARVNNLQIPQTDVLDEDSHNPDWAQEAGVANRLVVANWNLVAPVPMRTTGLEEQSLEFLISQRITLPEDEMEMVQIPKDVIGPLIDYAKHIALFKTSGAEFGATVQAYPLLFEAATGYNEVMAKNSRSFSFGADKATEATRKEFKVVGGDK